MAQLTRRDHTRDARMVVVRDPGFAAWILVSQTRLKLARAIRWCLLERSKQIALRAVLRARKRAGN